MTKTSKMTTSNKLTIYRVFIVIAIIVLLLLPASITTDVWSTSMNGFLSSDPALGTNSVKGLSWNYIAALVLFLSAAISDMVDGHLARKNNEITNFGKLFDPIADKILINSVIIIFAVQGIIPILIPIIFVLRDTFVDGLRILGASKGKDMSANVWGKQKTIWQFIGILLLLIFPSAWTQSTVANFWIHVPIYLATFFSIFSGVYYYVDNWNVVIEKG